MPNSFLDRCFLGTSGQRGQAIIELALVLPMLMLMLVGVVDLGRATTEYSKNVTIARDVINLAGRMGGLENGTCTSVGPNETCSTAHMPTHLFLFNRARTLASLRNISWVNWDHMQLSSTYNSSARTVSFTITVTFNTLFNGGFGSIPLKVSVTGPYMLGTGRQSGVDPDKQTEQTATEKYGTDAPFEYSTPSSRSDDMISGLIKEGNRDGSGGHPAAEEADPLLFGGGDSDSLLLK